MVAGRGSDQPEERPEWLPVGWTICTKTRNKGKLDRYYMSPSGQTMRSKAEVLRCKNKNMNTSIKHEFESQSACHIDAKRQSEHENLEVSHAIKEDTPISLPDGWIVETKTRKGGKSSGANYKIYINPATGYKCYSMKEVNRYVTGGEISAPISKNKTKTTLKSPDSVLTENEGSSMEQPPCPKNASKTKKNQIPTVAATDNQSPVRRSSSRSSMSKPSGNDSPKVTPKIHKASNKARAGKIKDAFEEQPHSQDVFPEHSLEEAVDISESIDKIIRNLSLDLKIPDISISFSLDQAEFDQVNKTGACNDSGVRCSENTREKKVKNNSVPPLPRKSRKRFDPHSAAANEDMLNANGAVEVVNETSADMVPSETNEMSDGNNPPLAIDKSDREKRSSKRKASRGKQSEADDVDPSPVIKKDAKFENNTRKQEETMTKSTRIKGHQKDETPTNSSSRVSRRLAGLDAGNADTNENDLRRNKRLRI